MAKPSFKEMQELRKMVAEQQAYGADKAQRIVCAACRWPDGHVILGIRHFSPDMRLSAALQGYDVAECREQGFVDQFGTYLTREEAFKIAMQQGQFRAYQSAITTAFDISKIKTDKLYSEDLY